MAELVEGTSADPATSSGGAMVAGTRALALPFARLALEDFFLLAMVVDGRKEVEGGNNGRHDSRVGAIPIFSLSAFDHRATCWPSGPRS